MTPRTDDQTASRLNPQAGKRRRAAARPEEHFDGGNPDPTRPERSPHPGSKSYIVVGRTWIAGSVVAASIALPVLVLAGLLMGLPAAGAAVVAVVMTPLVVLARAVAKFFF